ncbi:hypothetical protein [Aeromonas dhakensis]
MLRDDGFRHAMNLPARVIDPLLAADRISAGNQKWGIERAFLSCRD